MEQNEIFKMTPKVILDKSNMHVIVSADGRYNYLQTYQYIGAIADMDTSEISVSQFVLEHSQTNKKHINEFLDCIIPLLCSKFQCSEHSIRQRIQYI